MNGKNSERLVKMTVAFAIEMFLISLPNKKKFVNSGRRHVTRSSLLHKKYYSAAIYEILGQNKQSV